MLRHPHRRKSFAALRQSTPTSPRLWNAAPSWPVSATVPGPTITLYAGALASGTTTLVPTDGTHDLPDGLQSITARQVALGKTESAGSTALSVTNDNTPTFDVTDASPYFRVYRSGTLISSAYESGSTYTAPVQADGTWQYAIRAVDAAGNESAASEYLSVTISTKLPATPAPLDLQPASDTGPSSSDNTPNRLIRVLFLFRCLWPSLRQRPARGK